MANIQEKPAVKELGDAVGAVAREPESVQGRTLQDQSSEVEPSEFESPGLDASEFDAPDSESPELESGKSSKRWWSRRWLWAIPLVLLPMGAIAWQTGAPTVAEAPKEEAEQRRALPVSVVMVEAQGGYGIQRDYAGELVARRKSQLGFEGSGTVVAVLADQGDFVQAGQVIARLDDRSLKARRSQLVAEAASVEAQLRELQNGARREDIDAARSAVGDLEQQLALANLQADRRKDLYETGAIAREDWEREQFSANALQDRLNQAKSQLEKLKTGTRVEQVSAQAARLQQTKAAIAAVDIELSKTVLKAPYSGQVSDRLIDEGTVVSGGQGIVQLIEGGSLEARIGVPVDMAQRLPVGSRQQLTVDGQSRSAVVTTVLPMLEQESRTATVVLQLAAANNLRIGQTARLTVKESQTQDGFWVPATALVPRERGLWSVYGLGDASGGAFEVVRRDVEVLHDGGDRLFVRGTIQSGDRVISSGAHRIVPGQLVSVQ
ncbi:MAG: efflux RND transporter periplasmic adaptor subunit [Cyanobacteria bacterium P01_F01_bin.153]